MGVGAAIHSKSESEGILSRLSSEGNVPDFVLVESTGNGESEEEFVVLSSRGASELDVRRISGAPGLLDALRDLAPRRIILDFHVSFGRGLALLRALKIGAPESTLVARVRSSHSRELEPLYFSVEVQTSRVSLHRMRPEEFSEGWMALGGVPSGGVAL